MMALLSAAGLCAHAAVAQAQGAPAPAKPASAATAAPSAKRLPNPSTAGMGLSAMEADSEGCPRGPNGEEQCTVEVTGSGAGWKDASGSGGSSAGDGSAMCQPSKVLQAAPCTPDTPGSRGQDPDKTEQQKKKDDFDKECDDKRSKMDIIAKSNYDASADLCKTTYGGSYLGAPWGALWNLALFGKPMEDCLNKASSKYDGAIDKNRDDMKICKSNNPYK